MKMLLDGEYLTINAQMDEEWEKRELNRIRENRFKRIENEQNDGDKQSSESNDMSVERILSDGDILNRRIMARQEVSEAARDIVGRVRRVIEYFGTNHPDAPVEKIYLTGLATSVQGADALIAEELGMPVEILDVTEGVVFSRTAEEFEERGSEFLACFGAVVNPLGMRPIEAILRERKKNIAILSGAIFIAAAAILAGLIIKTSIDISYEKDMKALFEQNIAETEYIEDLNAVYIASQESIASMKATDALSFSMAEQLNPIISELEKSLPARSLVQSFSITGDSMTINFSTVTKEEAAKVLMQLKTIPYISEVTVGGIVENVDETSNRTEVVFTVNCTLQKPVEVPEGEQTTTEGTEVQ